MNYVYDDNTGEFVEVHSEPKILQFYFDGQPTKYLHDSVMFHWDVQDAQHLYLNDQSLDITNNSIQIELDNVGLNTFTLKLDAGGSIITRTVQIKVLELPNVEINVSSPKLKKGKGEKCTIKWTISNASSIKFIDGENSTEINNSGERIIETDESVIYSIETIGLDHQRTFTNEIKIDVFEESEVVFDSDKDITLPKVPIKLYWDVKNATKVVLDQFGEVSHQDDKILELDKPTTFKLIVTDEFETKEYIKTINTYPLPIIRSIMVPTPIINQNLSVEAHIENKQIQVNINTPYAKVPEFNGVKSDALISDIEFNELEFNIDYSWQRKLEDSLKKLRIQLQQKLNRYGKEIK